MPWYLITDSRGSPFEYPLSAELDPEGITARPGSALETHWVGRPNRAKFHIAPELMAAAARAPVPSWPARLFKVEPGARLWPRVGQCGYVYLVDVVAEISVFKVFGRKARTMELFFAGVAAMTTEDWIRVAALAAAHRNAVRCSLGPAAAELAKIAMQSYLEVERTRLKRQGELACDWVRGLLRIEKSDAPDLERQLMMDSLETATRALILGDEVPEVLRVNALAPFTSVIGPVWENPRRSPAQSPSTSLTSSPQVAQAGGGEGIWLSIS